ncbi:MAG: hypothetical protein KKF58_04390 [Gammaproteobacteria bacterium]|nr:hypothetical protein [Gammaproteobacteria bacterium]MBU1447530.1 hypothetical protein [Gammaproteobacteria bacterium]
MFEAISFCTQDKTNIKAPIDIGALVECMLFYEKTTIFANQAILAQLIRFFGVERLLVLIEEDLLKVVYTETLVGVFTTSKGNIQYHDVVEMSSPQHTYQDELRKICIDVTGRTGKGRRLANKIQDKIYVTKHDHIILEGARRAFLDQDYIDAAAKIVLLEWVPEIGDCAEMIFRTEQSAEGLRVETNLNFSVLNDAYHKRVSPSHSSITPASILGHVLEVERELYFSSSNLSELASSSLSAKLAGKKIDYIFNRTAKSKETLSNFNNFIFNDAKAIREAVNFGQVDLDELIKVLQKSKRFKEWIIKVHPDAHLIKSYYEEVTRQTIFDRLPGKSVRWAVFTGIGLTADAIATGGMGTIAGVALGALDSLYIDKIASGWRPNQFIEGDVRNLIGKNK